MTDLRTSQADLTAALTALIALGDTPQAKARVAGMIADVLVSVQLHVNADVEPYMADWHDAQCVLFGVMCRAFQR